MSPCESCSCAAGQLHVHFGGAKGAQSLVPQRAGIQPTWATEKRCCYVAAASLQGQRAAQEKRKMCSILCKECHILSLIKSAVTLTCAGSSERCNFPNRPDAFRILLSWFSTEMKMPMSEVAT